MVVDAESWRKRVGLGIGSGRREVLSVWGMLGMLQTLFQNMRLVHETPPVNQSAKRDYTLNVCRGFAWRFEALFWSREAACGTEAPKECLYMDKIAVLAEKPLVDFFWRCSGGAQGRHP